MRKLLLSLSLLVMTAMTAMAQYTVNITSDPIETWVCEQQIEFPAADIASALGIDVTTLQTMLAAPAEGETKEGLACIQLADGLSNVYTGNWNEWWMTMDGTPVGYGDDAVWFAGVEYLPAADAQGDVDAINFYAGQMPGVFKKIYVASTLKAKIVLKNGDKEVAFDVTLNVNPAVKSNLAEPTMSFAALEVVKEINATLNFTIGKEYGNIPQEIDITGAAEALGVSEDDLAAGIADVLLTRTYKAIAAEEGSLISGSELSDAMAVVLDDPNIDGWFGRYDIYDESTDETTVYPLNGLKAWGAGCTTYIHAPSIENGVLTLITGLHPAVGYSESGVQADVIELYIVNGTKAVKIVCAINADAPQGIPFEEMTKAGETTIEVTATIDNTYATKAFTVDMAAVLEAIGVESVNDFYTWASEGVLGDNHTEGSGGYYYNADGYIQGWGSDAAFFIARTSTSLEDGNFTVGQMANAYFKDITEPTTVYADMIFLGVDKYYVVKLAYTVKPEEQKGDDFEFTKVADEQLVKQILLTEGGTVSTKSPLDLDYIEQVLGTKDFKIYSIVTNTNEDGETELSWTDKYNCTPTPGFWYQREEFQNCVLAQGWVGDNGASNSFGFTYANGEFTWYWWAGTQEAGAEYQTHVYLVNEATGDYIDYTVVVKYVEEVAPEAETVGHSDVIYKVSAQEAEDALCVVEINAKKMYDALGLDADLMEAASIVAQKSSTMFASSALGESLGYNDKGYFVGSDDEENCALQAVVEAFDEKLMVSFDLMSLNFASDDALTIPVRLGVEYDGKRYMYTINLTNKAVDRRIPLTGGSGEGSEMAIEVLDTNDNGEPLSATYTITNATWGDNASHMSLFKYAPLSASMMDGYDGVIVVFDGEVPASTGDPTYGFIPVGFVCPAGWKSIKDTDKFVYKFTDEEKTKGIDDFSIFFNASGDLKSTSLTIKGVYLVTDVDTDPTETGIEAPTAPAATVAPAGIYTISGAKVSALQRGLNIVKMADGSVKKILVK